VAVDEVVVAVTHASAHHVEQDFALAGLVDFEVFDRQRNVGFVQDCGFHEFLLRSD
jgi:hypothetical protein